MCWCKRIDKYHVWTNTKQINGQIHKKYKYNAHPWRKRSGIGRIQKKYKNKYTNKYKTNTKQIQNKYTNKYKTNTRTNTKQIQIHEQIQIQCTTLEKEKWDREEGRRQVGAELVIELWNFYSYKNKLKNELNLGIKLRSRWSSPEDFILIKIGDKSWKY